MPKTGQDLTELVQVRISKEGMDAIRLAADKERTSLAEFARRALYRAAKFVRKERR